MDWHAVSLASLFKKGKSSEHGLTSKEAHARLSKYGTNVLAERMPAPLWLLFVRQFNSPLKYILLAVSVLVFIINRPLDGVFVLFAVFMDGIFSTWQAKRAEKAIFSLKKLLAPRAEVMRDKKIHLIPAQAIVPGDIIILSPGAFVPADIRLVEVINLKISEASLTGESVAVEKQLGILSKETPIFEQTNMAFMGTTVVYGRGLGLVVATGQDTQVGAIAKVSAAYKEAPTPLQKSIGQFGLVLALVILVLVLGIFLVGLLQGRNLLEIALISVSTAVSAVPEHLPVLVTLALVIGSTRMAKRAALVRNLSSVETLGETDVICVDKTGTLTYGELTAQIAWSGGKEFQISGFGYNLKGSFILNGSPIEPKSFDDLHNLLLGGTLANDAHLVEEDSQLEVIGDPTEGALLVAAAKAEIEREELELAFPRVDEVPFTSNRRFMMVLSRELRNDKKILWLKGAPETVLDMCKWIQIGKQKIPLRSEMRKEVEQIYKKYAGQALRVLAFAKKTEEISGNLSEQKDFVFLGMLAMADQYRENIDKELKKVEQADIRVIMLTGDHKLTAMAIAEQVGLSIKRENILEGSELLALTRQEQLARIESVTVFARVLPEHKKLIVDLLQEKGHVVSMTGDGVNDAPALIAADIGVAMGSGTDVARDAADIILTDNSFHSIGHAVSEGRRIFNNIKKSIIFFLTTTFGEIAIVSLPLFFGFPLSLLPLQILWTHLIHGEILEVALVFEPSEKEDMKEPPRARTEGFLRPINLIYILVGALTMAIGSIAVFSWGIKSGVPIEKLRTIIFCGVVFFQLFNIINARSLRRSIFTINPFANLLILIALPIALLAQLAVVYLPFLQGIFQTVSLGLTDWLLVASVSLSTVLVSELFKFVVRRTKTKV